MAESNQKNIFSGLVITSFSWAIVGPLTMKYFADYGATVIRVESTKRPCTLRISSPYKDKQPGLDRSGYFNHFNSNIFSMTLNMENPGAIKIVEKLVKKSDVVMENFTPGVIEKWGLDYEALKQMKPDIIFLRQSGFGTQGPNAHQPAFGMILAAVAGIPNFIGRSEKEALPFGISPYTDCISPRFAAAALIAALDYRDKTGKGQLLDISQFETALSFIAPGLLDYAADRKEPQKIGNSHPAAVPHGVYQCKGDDRWCTIAVCDDKQWEKLCGVIGKPGYANDAKYKGIINRKKNEAEIDKLIGEWTIGLTPEEVMERLQEAGIPSGVVKNAADIFNDPQLQHRELFWKLDHPEIGEFSHLGQSIKLQQNPAKAFRPSPRIGEHTEYVCSQILGMKDEEFIEYTVNGVFE